MIDAKRLLNGLFWQEAWTLTVGCDKISPGCDNCWAENQDRQRRNHPNDQVALRAQAALTLGGGKAV